MYSLLEERDRHNPETLALAPPIEQLSAESPPILILHGALDSDVEPALSAEFAACAISLQISCEYILIEGAVHGFVLRTAQRDLRHLLHEFLRKHL